MVTELLGAFAIDLTYKKFLSNCNAYNCAKSRKSLKILWKIEKDSQKRYNIIIGGAECSIIVNLFEF